MPKFVMVAASKAKEGRDAEYTEWYDTIHIKDICSITGVKSGRRLTALPEVSPNTPPGAYLATYEIEADDPSSVLAEMMQRSQAGEFTMTDSIDMESAQIWFYRQD